MKETIAIALSGGVDSLVCAYLLKQQGHPLIGIHFLTGFESGLSIFGEEAKPETTGDLLAFGKEKMAAAADQLDIPIEIADIRKEFKETIIHYFTREYLSGKTPNPCLVCNVSIKFDVLLKLAEKLGAKRLATGHYAKNTIGKDGLFHLSRGDDPVKDQSYFLTFLNQHQLSRACFPLGGMRKTDVLALAEKENLHPVVESESQDICFIRDQSYGDFLARQEGFKATPGLIVDVHGNELGCHSGLHLFTVGQRRGINLPAKAPYYVVRIDPGENRLVVGFEQDLLSSGCRVAGINWICSPPESAICVDTQVRYRHRAAKSILTPAGNNSAFIRFNDPQTAVTPGQGAVFYKDHEVLGGGWIESGK